MPADSRLGSVIIVFLAMIFVCALTILFVVIYSRIEGQRKINKGKKTVQITAKKKNSINDANPK